MASEPEVRQSLGQARQRDVEQVVAQHSVGDQWRRQVREGGGEDAGRIGEVRLDGEPFGRQARIPSGRTVLPHRHGQDRDGTSVAGRDEAVMAAAA
jgi:hypothetical protein